MKSLYMASMNPPKHTAPKMATMEPVPKHIGMSTTLFINSHPFNQIVIHLESANDKECISIIYYI